MTFSQLASEEERQTLKTLRKVFLGQWERRVVQKPGAGSLEVPAAPGVMLPLSSDSGMWLPIVISMFCTSVSS